MGYIPRDKVIGASKRIRMIPGCNTAPMTHEALTVAIVAHVRQLTCARRMELHLFQAPDRSGFRVCQM